MSSKKTERVMTYVSLVGICIIALLGVVLALAHSSSAGLAMFEIITFSVSIAALVLAVLGSVNNAYQMRTIRRISREVHTAVRELKEIDAHNIQIEKELGQAGKQNHS